jgi:O-antigen/teichoic acid export membrane protein
MNTSLVAGFFAVWVGLFVFLSSKTSRRLAKIVHYKVNPRIAGLGLLALVVMLFVLQGRGLPILAVLAGLVLGWWLGRLVWWVGDGQQEDGWG